MKDYSNWVEYKGSSEGSGRSEKIWLLNPETDEIGLFKYKKDEYTTDHVSECIAYQLSRLLDIKCARFEIGIYNQRKGSMSYNILHDKQILIEGINFVLLVYPEYDINELVDKKTGNRYSLEMIEEVIEPFGKFEDFLIFPIFDYLIGNTDRHQSNWAMILEENRLVYSPLYDNSSSLCAYLKEEALEACLGNDKVKWKAVVETKSKSIIRINNCDDAKPTHLVVLNYIRDHYYEETIELAKKIIRRVTEENILDILENFTDDDLSPKRKKVILKFLLSKVEKLREVYFGTED